MLERFRGCPTTVLGPIARLLVRLGVSPDVVTIAGTLGVAIGALICFPQGWLWQGVLVVTIFVISDMIDGLMAKITGKTSNWGAFLDSTSDRLGDAAVFGGILLYFVYRQDSTLWGGHRLSRPGLRAVDLVCEGSSRKPRIRVYRWAGSACGPARDHPRRGIPRRTRRSVRAADRRSGPRRNKHDHGAAADRPGPQTGQGGECSVGLKRARHPCRDTGANCCATGCCEGSTASAGKSRPGSRLDRSP